MCGNCLIQGVQDKAGSLLPSDTSNIIRLEITIYQSQLFVHAVDFVKFVQFSQSGRRIIVTLDT